MSLRRVLTEVSRQQSQFRAINKLFARSYLASLEFGGNAGIVYESRVPLGAIYQKNILQPSTCSMFSSRVLFSSEASIAEGVPTEAAKELYDKMLKSVLEQRTAPPNAWLWSLIEKCANHDDIKLLFDILQNLRRFRLSNLRIHENFNSNLCLEVSRACVRVEAIDLAKKTLWKHNLYGLTPSVASAHSLLLYAKEHNDAKLLVDVMKLLKANDLPLQPGTADIVFSICYNTDRWDLMSKYAKRFVLAGAKLRRTSFDTWMKFAAKQGDVDGLWKIEKLRSNLMKSHTIVSGFSCAKGLLLERKPDDAAAIIQILNQTLPEANRPDIMIELQKLVSDWPLDVLKHCKEEGKKELAAALQADIPVMINSILGLGVKVNVDIEDFKKKSLLC